MNRQLRQLLAALIVVGFGTASATEVAEITTTAQATETAQETVDRAAEEAEEAADEAVESLTEETKQDLDFSLVRHRTLRAVASSR